MTPPAGRQPPRLVARAIAASFLTVAVILATVFALVSLDLRARARQSVVANLDAGQQVFERVEKRRAADMLSAVSILAENPTLKAALDTWQSERSLSGAGNPGLVATVQRETDKIAARVNADVLAVLDPRGAVVVSAGTHAAAWPAGATPAGTAAADAPAADALAVTGGDVFRVRTVPLQLGSAVIGSLALGTSLDETYVRDLATLARAGSAIVIDGRVQASTLPPAVAADLARVDGLDGIDAGVYTLGGRSWAVRRVDGVGPAGFFALASIDDEAAAATRSALRGLAWIGVIALAVGALGSLWLARALTRPIDTLSASLAEMTVARRFDTPVPATGNSRELDALASTFNALIRAVAEAEAETQAAYLGAIRALAAALDARDPYTAGHSERVSALAVEMGRVMRLPEQEVSILRLGALLHDIGKIGVPDEVLRKPTALTKEEFELIRAHPVIGARILRTIPFLSLHLPIVELHHERPDGHGYPYGLAGEAIPVAARIVHVADAFDAMTSARAYRPGRLPHEAIAELQRCVDADFDGEAVRALVTAMPKVPAAYAGFDPTALQWAALHRTRV
jgi:putative nucleotidyltransferase with HDIG domain